MAERIANKFNFPHVSVSDLLRKELRRKNSNSQEINEAMQQGNLVGDRFVLDAVESRLSASDCLINGFVLTGFPKNKAQINYLNKNNELKPSLLVIIDLDDEEIYRRSRSRKINVNTGRLESCEEGAADTNEMKTLEEDQPEVVKKRIENFRAVVNEVETDLNVRVLRINGESDVNAMVEQIGTE